MSGHERRSGAPRIVVFSTLFPHPGQPLAGVFIRERMFRVARHVPMVVVSPVPWFPLQGLIRRFRPGFRPSAPRVQVQDGIEVRHPRFLSVPGLFKRLDGLLMALSVLPAMLRLRREFRFDLIDAHFAYPDGYAATLLGRWLGVPVAITLRGTEARLARDPIFRSLIAAALRRATRVLSVSESLRQLALAMGTDPSKTRVVANGVDVGKFCRLPRANCRRALGIDERAPVVVSVGNLVERKGFHRVIECLPELRERFPGLVYLIVGGAGAEGDYSAQLTRLVRELGLEETVRFLGPVAAERLSEPLSAADVFALATSNEGWANVFLEAMACGLPVVTTDVGGNREVVCEEWLGAVVPYWDPGAFTRRLAEALERDWGRDAIVGYAKSNGWDGRIETLLDTFREIADASGAPGEPGAVWR